MKFRVGIRGGVRKEKKRRNGIIVMLVSEKGRGYTCKGSDVRRGNQLHILAFYIFLAGAESAASL